MLKDQNNECCYADEKNMNYRQKINVKTKAHHMYFKLLRYNRLPKRER